MKGIGAYNTIFDQSPLSWKSHEILQLTLRFARHNPGKPARV